MKQGERNKEVQIAKKLKAMGMETTLIIQATGLTADEIAEL